MNHTLRTLLWVLLDAALVNLAMILAQQLRFDIPIPQEFFQRYVNIMPVMTLLCLFSLGAFGLYRNMWQYASADSVVQITLATLVGALATYGYSLVMRAITQPENHHMLHRTVYLLFWILLTIVIGGSRLAYRVIVTSGRSLRKDGKAAGRRAMIIGAGWAGANVVREMQSGRYGNAAPVVVVDDDPSRAGSKLKGVPVVSGTGNILRLASDYEIDEIIIAIATPNGEMKPLLEKCLATGCRVRRVAALQEVNSSDGPPTAVRDINIGDLLGRPEKQMDMAQVAAVFRGKTVLITGGGGSIGGELCNQILSFEPEKIVLYDISENYMYDLFFQLQEQYKQSLRDKLILRVGSIRDPERLAEVFGEFSPEIVIHAAAHKHVPLMEDCPSQAVKNNVFGTYLTAKTAMEHGVKRFVLISTDKAVNPTNIMGATKRLAEIIIEALNQQGKTEFTAVRFGNVLGSHGSVVPLFERQIRAGGPITLTHPEIIRYFMTIPEAAALVLQAASIAKGGELFVLDMGQPVKIRELAERMIQLYASQGQQKIDIVYTGLRPGEKLYEELLMDDEGITRTEREKIFIAKPEIISRESMDAMLTTLQACLDEGGDVRACLHSVLPSFLEPEDVNRRAQEEHRLDAAASDAPGA
ncbi:MAG: nucleoside-diphosphate sugar epimerase/dehydratase [Candidatus Limiplasma sp.]|nr:nucleoside-diphosphate sugar epimerase/dehydratase [Candidatus Limiplasma sp.]